jgi:internalin A
MAKKKQTEQQKPKEILELEEYYGIRITRDVDGGWGDDKHSYSLDLVSRNVVELRLIGITDLKPIPTIENLRTLVIYQVSELDFNELRKCKELNRIRLSGIQNTELDFSPISHIKELVIQGRGMFDITRLSVLDKLNLLALIDFELVNLSDLENFIGLDALYLDRCHHLNPELLPNLKNLKRLYVSDCGVEGLTWIGKYAESVNHLTLSENKFDDITELCHLKKLAFLDISDNSVSDLDALSDLENLRDLRIWGNKIEVIPESLIRRIEHPLGFKELPEGNPIKFPPVELFAQGKDATLQWFDARKKGDSPLNEVRVMLIGHGSAGKTSLMKRLTLGDYDDNEDSTHGINMDAWYVKEEDRTVKANLWDFGGQQMQHSVHKFFLSNACLYVLVSDNRKEDDPQYWLEHIRTLAKDAPVVVVYNKQDQKPDEILGRKVLRDRYPNIIGFYNVSCKSGYGIPELRKDLEKLVLESESSKRLFPITWFNVKKRLEEATTIGKNHLSYAAYQVMCEEEDVQTESEQRTLLTILSSIGTISFFDDAELDRLQILNPEWVTEGVYRIVTDDRVADRKGDITLKDFPSLLYPEKKGDFEYKKEHYPYLLALMKKFELCHVREDGHILIPARFSTEPKANYVDYRGKDARLYFFFYHSFLPVSIIHRFITRHLKYTVNEDYWYRGIVIKDPSSDTEAFVELNEQEGRIYLWLKGEDIVGYWGYLRRQLRELSDFFNGIAYDEYVGLDEENRGKEWVKYSNLQRTLRSGRASYYDPTLDKEIDVIKYLSLFDGDKIIQDFERGREKGRLHRIEEQLGLYINVSPTFNQSQHLEQTINIVVVEQHVDEILAKLSVLLAENHDEAVKNRLRQVKDVTEKLEKVGDARQAKREGLLDRYTGFMSHLKQGGEWVNTINDATKNLPELVSKMEMLLQQFM